MDRDQPAAFDAGARRRFDADRHGDVRHRLPGGIPRGRGRKDDRQVGPQLGGNRSFDVQGCGGVTAGQRGGHQQSPSADIEARAPPSHVSDVPYLTPRLGEARSDFRNASRSENVGVTMTQHIRTGPLGFPWTTRDPFLFCVHHLDHYPVGNEALGPAASLAGRDIGMDFTIKDGWRMYHGRQVPGFPAHPHRGFETVTLVRRGHIDHADSLGAAARFGHGDVQWMTAGRGIVHSEMFPLLDSDADRISVELFQIWLNLPARHKMVPPHFAMLWNHMIREAGRQRATATLDDRRWWWSRVGSATPRGPAPPPNSWASAGESDVAIWTIRMSPERRADHPRRRDPSTARSLYFFVGDRALAIDDVSDRRAPASSILTRRKAVTAEERRGARRAACCCRGEPIGEPVAHHGPFVMNTRQELHQAMMDYQQTRFGGWPWSDEEPVHHAGRRPIRPPCRRSSDEKMATERRGLIEVLRRAGQGPPGQQDAAGRPEGSRSALVLNERAARLALEHSR